MIPQTSEQRAAISASQITNLANNLAKQHASLKANGAPAQGNAPAFTKEDYAAALGSAGMTVLDAYVTANPQS